MSAARILGVILLIGGIVLVIIGISESRSLADSLSSLFRGHLTERTSWYIFGGLAAAVVGLIVTIRS